MSTFQRYFSILLIAFFSVAATGSIAMAHCGSSVQGRDNVSIEKKMDGCSHTHSAEDKKNNDHKKINEKIQGCCSADPGDHTSSSGENSTTSCLNCGAGLCQSQNVINAKTPTVFYATLSNFLIEKNINPEAVFIAIIPDPPNSIS